MSKIITTPDPVLREISKPILKFDNKTLGIIKDIQKTLTGDENPRGIGLSGVQIGKPIRVFAMYLPKSGDPNDEKSTLNLQTFINPEILETSKNKTLGPNKEKPILEGCLSIPGIWGPVHRHEWVKLKWQMANGKWQIEKFKDFPSRVIQHEMDHLNGILFTDHSLRDKLPLYESRDEELIRISI